MLCSQKLKISAEIYTFSIVNRNRRQWTAEHLHATSSDLVLKIFINAPTTIQSKDLRSADVKGHASKAVQQSR